MQDSYTRSTANRLEQVVLGAQRAAGSPVGSARLDWSNRRSVLSGIAGIAGQLARDSEYPGGAEQENERQAEDQRRGPDGGEGQAGHGNGGADAGERPVQAAVAVP